MVRRSDVVRSLAVLVYVVLFPLGAWAQQAASIDGQVKDASGAVIPGITVEAASPVLIEKLRTVITDSDGRYKFIDLRPGTYVVTFTLQGFTTFKREGLDLPAGFTAEVNVEMRVGQLEETLTVTGQSPLVDVRNVRQTDFPSR
jgi:5-hydroxyisourate hydrolase-like protein (transthyretin family)